MTGPQRAPRSDQDTAAITRELVSRVAQLVDVHGVHLHVATRDELTAREPQVAPLARDGMSNIEIGARLFLSQHTVAYHLRTVFSKLGISSRRELAAALPGSESELVPA